MKEHIQSKIIKWYLSNQRTLPWRNTNNPYFVWISEIILQQTRVDQGLPYYTKFVSKYATIHDLARASEREVLSDWQGLGYYSRARNLHFTAKQIVNENKGVFPSTFEEILKLKGVGRYTAAAIASFCFNLPNAVVDGNVFRVLSRIYDIDLPINFPKNQRIFEEIANELLDVHNPGIFNQAIMEFGALQCKPVSPNCSTCELRIHCLSYKNKTVIERPVKLKMQKIKGRFFVYWVVKKDEKILLRQRKENDIWKMMYEFPSKEFANKIEKEIFLKKYLNLNQKNLNHILSHQRIEATFISLDNFELESKQDAKWIPLKDVSEYPLHRLMTKYLEEMD